MSTANQRKSEGAKRAWRRRKEADRARGRKSRRDLVVEASTPGRSSFDVAAEFGVSASYVRSCWALAKLPPSRHGMRADMDDRWYSLDVLPAGRLRVRVRWPGFVVEAASDIDKRGVRHWHEASGRDLRPLRAPLEAWQPLDAARWTWPNGVVPAPLRARVRPALAVVGGVDFDAVAAALEMEEWREAARAQHGAAPPPDAHVQWWRDVTRVRYEPMGAVGLDHGEARIMRHLILERAMPLDLRRQRSNAAVLADLKLSWADVYGEQSRGDDWEPPLVPQPEDHRDFETVMSWFAEVSPSKREMTVLRGRMLAPPVTWVALGDVIQRSWQRAQQVYREAITDLVSAANRPAARGGARLAALRERNRRARG